MKLSFRNFQLHLDYLRSDVYSQPSDVGHTDWAIDAIDWMCDKLVEKHGVFPFTNVLDVGCGDGFCREIFLAKGVEWTGVTCDLEDFSLSGERQNNIFLGDISFLPFRNYSYHLIFARHVLEHSPMPLITLLEWARISENYLCVILPAPEYWGKCGRNHYYVMEKDNWECLFERANWKIIAQSDFTNHDPLFVKHWHPTKSDEWKRKELESNPLKVVEFRYVLEKTR